MSLTTDVKWGSTVQQDQYTRLRLGYIFTQSPATVSSSTGQVTVTCKLYAQTWNRMWDYQAPLSWSGSFGSGSTTVRFETYNTNNGWADSNIVLLRTFTRTVTASEANAIKTSLSASFRLAPTISASATVSGTWTTAQKPQSIFPPEPIVDPMVVTSLTADGTCTFQWTRVSPGSASQPYTYIDLQMWTPTTNAYNAMATVGNTYSFTVQRMVDFSLYRFRARPRNAAGAASAWAYTPFVYTEPDAPRNVKLKAGTNGSVVVTWDAPAKAPDTTYYQPRYEVVRRANRGAWEYSASVETANLTWTHTGADPSVEYQYAVRTVGRTSPDVVLYSPFVQSTYIRLSAPPLTPIVNGPADGVRFGQDVSLWWDHNPQDGSDQTGYELEWWTDKDTTVRKTAQTASAWNKFVIRPPQDNDRVRWRVRTKGVHPDFSPWTATQTFGVSTPPTVVLSTTPGPYWGTSPTLRATWTYTDPAGQAATKYEVKTTDASGTVLREYAGATTSPSGTVAWSGSVPRIEDGQTLTVSVRVADSYGVFSDWTTATVTADYAEPPIPAISATFNEDTGTATVVVTIPPGEPLADMIEVFRYLGEGVWERKTQGPGTGFVWEDTDPVFGDGTHNLYVARAVTSYPSYSMSEVAMLRVVPEGCDEWFWLSSNRYPERRARFRGNAKVEESAGTVGARVHHYGDRFPTSYTTLMNERKLSVSGMLDRRATRWQDWLDLGMTEGTFTYRDPLGRRLNVRLDPVNIGSALPGYESVSFNLEVVEGPLDAVAGLPVPSNALTETGANLYSIVQGSGQVLEKAGIGLYALNSRPDARMSLIEEGHNLYVLVDWDNPTVEWCARDSER